MDQWNGLEVVTGPDDAVAAEDIVGAGVKSRQ